MSLLFMREVVFELKIISYRNHAIKIKSFKQRLLTFEGGEINYLPRNK